MIKSKKAARSIKHADIRAGLTSGRASGWPSKPDTSGDPFDPGNMERCDAHVLINEGMVGSNASAVNAAFQVSRRQIGVVTFLVIALSYLVAWFFGITDEVKKELKPDYSSFSDTESGQELSALLSKFYTSTPVAMNHKLDHLINKFGWSPVPAKNIPDLVIDKQSFESFIRFSSEKKKSQASAFSSYCQENKIEISDCALREANNYGPSVASYLDSIGENVSLYVPGLNPEINAEAEKKSEEKLAEYAAKIPKSAKNYCNSDSRLFAESWPLKVAQEKSSQMSNLWSQDGSLPETAAFVGSMKELINHRIDGDADCKNPHITALKVNSGAIKYLVSVKGRHSQTGENRIFTKLYFLAKLNGSYKTVYVACANCNGIPGLNEGMQSEIVSGLSQSATGVVEAFDESNMNLSGE